MILKKIISRYENKERSFHNFINSVNIFVFSTIFSIYISYRYYDSNIVGIEDKYKEFIYGDTIFLNYNKSVDINVIIIFIFVFLGCYFAFDLFFKLKMPNIDKKVDGTNQFLMIIIIPFIIYYLPKIINNEITYNYIAQYLIYVLLWYIYFYKNQNNHRKIIKGILIILFSYMSSIAISYFINRYYKIYIGYTYIMIVLTAICFICFNKYGIFLSQISLPIYFIRILENGYNYRNELIYIENNYNLKILVLFLIIGVSLFSIYEIRKYKNSLFTFSTISVILFLVIWNDNPLIYVLDEYHYGELFTAFDQIFHKENIQYKDYIPVKGYFHIIIGYINELFFNGGYVSLQKASDINVFLSKILVLGVSCFYFSKELVLLFIFLNIIPSAGNYFLVLPAIYLLTRRKIINEEYNFIFAYLYITFIAFIYYQSFGIAISLSVLPMVMYYIYRLLKGRILPKKGHIVILFFGIILFISNFQMIFYGLKYSLINASSNLLYWGNDSGYLSGREFINFISMSMNNIWIIFVIIGILIIIKCFRNLKKDELLILIFTIIFPITILSYTQGRHDGILKRANTLSVIAIILLLFYSVYRYNKVKNNNNFIFLIVMLLLYFNYSSTLMISDLKLKTEISYLIPDNMVMTNNSNIKKIGTGFIEKSTLDDLESEKKLFDAVCLDDNSTFLIIDSYLTQSARYSLFDYNIPTLSHSVLNMPSINSQRLELERLDKFDIPIVRVSDGINRYYLFHKKFLNGEYVYTTYNGREYLFKKNVFTKLKKEFNLIELALPNYYSTIDFGVLPIKWGNGYKISKEKFDKVEMELQRTFGNDVYNLNGWEEVDNTVDPFTVYSIKRISDGDNIDFIKFTLNQKVNKEVRMQFFWSDEHQGFSEENSVRFVARQGDIVIPVNMNLFWRNSANISNIRFDIDGLDKGESFNIENVELIKLKN